jgi:hypothetical protein
MVKFKRINLNFGLSILIFGDTVTQSRLFVQKFSEILKKRIFCVLCGPFFTIINKDSLLFFI